MSLARLIVHSGWHERRWCPVQTGVSLDSGIDLNKLILWDETNRQAAPMQAWRAASGQVGVGWIIEAMPPQQSRLYELRIADEAQPVSGGAQLVENRPGELEIQLDEAHCATYNFGAQVIRPYLYPVRADDGTGITRNWPMVADAAGETTDHIHHKGIWTAHGEINGRIDNWSEGQGHGWQIHRDFSHRFSGSVAAGFTQHLDWTDAGRQVILTETRAMTFYRTSGPIRLFDYSVTLHASHGQITLADTKEAGLLSIRVAPSMDARNSHGGRIENAYGGLQEAETWGQRAPWCDYAGPIGDQWYGVCLMDHPTNPRHPTHWHVRNYGLMTANCFGLHDYTGDPTRRWDLVIPAGESRTWRYRVLIHHGDAQAAHVADHYHAFAHPPAITTE